MAADRTTVLSLMVLAAVCVAAVIFFQWGAQ
jgi:hypothetical protein